MADLAKAIGLSTAYIYKFFDSKQSIGEAVCGTCLGRIAGEAEAIATDNKSAVDRLRRIFRVLPQQSADLFFHDRKMHDLVAASFEEKWRSSQAHSAKIFSLVKAVVTEGRASGEFERKTPLDETCRAIIMTMEPFQHPILLEEKLDTLDADATLMANLVLRSLAP